MKHCPRCGSEDVIVRRFGRYVAFCVRCLAYLLQSEFEKHG